VPRCSRECHLHCKLRIAFLCRSFHDPLRITDLQAKHSFEKGQGKTGGIMDYGDGKLKGAYQFYTKYRKAEVCREISKKLASASSRFTFGTSKVCWVPVKVNKVDA
jgi:hypothetical protein